MDPLAATFAKVAVRNKLLTTEQANECLAVCKKDDGKKIADVVVELGHMSAAQADALREAIEKKISNRQKPAGSAAPPPQPATEAPAPEPEPSPPAVEEEPLPFDDDEEDESAEQFEAVLTPEMEAQQKKGMDWSSLAGKSVTAYLESARNAKASDIHLNVGAPPAVRIHGVLRYMQHPILTPEDTKRFVEGMLSAEQLAELKERRELDMCFVSKKGNRYRTSVYKQRLGYAVISRIVPDRIMSLEELGLPQDISRFTEYHQGLVLVTGPAGCGKTATLAALVDMINEQRNDHIIVLEEPIELVHESKTALVSQREVGPHTDSFSAALRAALREDPDIIVVGEMRDLETISLAITAAETGHLVIGTLHTSNAAKTIDRVLDVFPPEEQGQIRAMVSESLRGVVSQQLVPRADGKGRVVAVELLFMTSAVRKLIFEGRTYQMRSIIQTGKKQGMKLMDESLKELVGKKLVTADEAESRAEDPKTVTGAGDE